MIGEKGKWRKNFQNYEGYFKKITPSPDLFPHHQNLSQLIVKSAPVKHHKYSHHV